MRTAPEAPTAAVVGSHRPAHPEDAPFLTDLFVGDRLPGFVAAGLPEAQARALLEDQFRIQTAAYTRDHPRAETRILMSDGRPVGRAIVSREHDRLRLVDLLVRPDERDAGIGTRALHDLQREARELGLAVELSVVTGSPARRLYEREGFLPCGTTPPVEPEPHQHVRMRWSAS